MTDGVRRDAAGFRLRGLDATRIETFTDAAFAFALTLLVISLSPPQGMDALREALRAVPSFVLSATMLMTFWWAHHVWSRRYGLDDGMTVVLSCLLVFTVLVYVYPLRFVADVLVAWIAWLTGLPVGRPVGADARGAVDELFAVYGVGFTLMAASMVLLNLHAWRRRAALALDAVERHETRTSIGAWALLAGTGLLSVLVALTVDAPGLPGWCYMILPVAMPVYARRRARARPALEGV